MRHSAFRTAKGRWCFAAYDGERPVLAAECGRKAASFPAMRSDDTPRLLFVQMQDGWRHFPVGAESSVEELAFAAFIIDTLRNN